MVFAPNMAVCSVHFPSTDNQWISLFHPLFLRHFPGNDTETKREGKGLFHGLCDKNFFSCIKQKPTIGEKNLFAIYTKILTKVPVCACRKKKCADGYFFFGS